MIGLFKLRLQLNAGKRRANLTRDSKVLVFSTTPRSSKGTEPTLIGVRSFDSPIDRLLNFLTAAC